MNNTLPESNLVKELNNKIPRTNISIDFDYIGLLNSFRQKVCLELNYINVLFPEYTPHNEDYHINSLFRIADSLLGIDLIKSMNVVELFILICSIYAHDWGMAVNEKEKKCILVGETNDDFSFINGEINEFKEYLFDNFIENANDISLDHWRNYVRKTHAIRSGKRSYDFFKSYNNGIAEAISRICEGHWLDVSKLTSNQIYPTTYSVLGEIVNLRALTVYVRLIDLLDITEERTPYVIWKYVCPQNNYSKMEWEKHRALHSITFPSYSDFRNINIDGSTDSHEVYAAIEDLKFFCNEQLKQCLDLLYDMKHEYHMLDIHHIEWNITTKGFNPIPIRFEFNRNRMFQILGDEIYGEDPYVFLRELLQNSIDAIHSREKLYKRRNMRFNDFGEISVNIQKDLNNDIVITWKDNGIGMNEYIVKNYLSIAGNSYYSSDDFRKLGLNMDPISRFGIGILSCWTVADCIEIETCRDLYLEKSFNLLKITINSINNFFRIEKVDSNNSLYTDDYNYEGTLIKIYIKKEKLMKRIKNIDDYNITRYLHNVAGFVDIPIIINEYGKKSVILHPYYYDKLKNNYNDYNVLTLNMGFIWNELFLPQDIDKAKKYFSEEKISIDKNLGIKEFEGVITKLVTNDTDIEIVNNYSEISLYKYVNNSKTQIDFRTKEDIKVKGNFFIDISPSCRVNNRISIYKDGILVSDIDDFQFNLYFYNHIYTYQYTTRIILNLPSNKENELDISRKHITFSNNFGLELRKSYIEYIANKYKDKLELYNNEGKYKLLRNICNNYLISLDEFYNILPKEFFIAVFLCKNGQFEYKVWDELINKINYLIPDFLNPTRSYLEELIVYDIYNEIDTQDNSNTKESINILQMKEKLKNWQGENSILFSQFDSTFKNNFFTDNNLHFIKAPIPKLVLPQRVLYPINKDDEDYNLVDYLLKIENDDFVIPNGILYLINVKLSAIFKEKSLVNDYIDFGDFVYFEKPYNEYFSYEQQYMNVNNIKVRKYLNLLGKIILCLNEHTISLDQIGLIVDAIDHLDIGLSYKPYKVFISRWENMWNLAKKLNICNFDNILDLIPKENEIINNDEFNEDTHSNLYNIDLRDDNNWGPFGEVIKL